MDLDAFVAAVAQRDMHTIYTGAHGRIAWEGGIKGHIALHNGALYVLALEHALDADDLIAEHGPFATFDEAYAMYILLGSCRAGN